MENDLHPGARLHSAKMKAGMNVRVGTPWQGQARDRDSSPEAPSGLQIATNTGNPLKAITGRDGKEQGQSRSPPPNSLCPRPFAGSLL